MSWCSLDPFPEKERESYGGKALAGAWASTRLVIVEWWGLVDGSTEKWVDPVSTLRRVFLP